MSDIVQELPKKSLPDRIHRELRKGETIYHSALPCHVSAKFPEGKWIAQVRREESGHLVKYPVKGFGSPRDALDYLKGIRPDERGRVSAPRQGEATVDDLYEFVRTQRQKRLSESTKDRKEIRWRLYIKPEWGDCPLSQVTRRSAQEWITEVEDKIEKGKAGSLGLPQFEKVRTGSTKNYVLDSLGSVTGLASQGSISGAARYSPYGRTLAGASGAAMGWAGAHGYYPTGLSFSQHYVRARLFDSLAASWTTLDPLWPQESPYGYAANSPISNIDASGSQTDGCKPESFEVSIGGRRCGVRSLGGRDFLVLAFIQADMLCRVKCPGCTEETQCALIQFVHGYVAFNGKKYDFPSAPGSMTRYSLDGITPECKRRPSPVRAGPHYWLHYGLDAPGVVQLQTGHKDRPCYYGDDCKSPFLWACPAKISIPQDSNHLTIDIVADFKTYCGCPPGPFHDENIEQDWSARIQVKLMLGGNHRALCADTYCKPVGNASPESLDSGVWIPRFSSRPRRFI